MPSVEKAAVSAIIANPMPQTLNPPNSYIQIAKTIEAALPCLGKTVVFKGKRSFQRRQLFRHV